MPITLYDAFVPTVRQMVGSFARILGNADEWAAGAGTSEADMLGARLHETMLPFPFQVRSIAHHSMGAIEAVRSGVFDAFGGESPDTLAGMQELLARTIVALDSVSAGELEARADADVVFTMKDVRIPSTVSDFLLSFSQPNFFFHSSTAYGLLRQLGMPLGKRDFLGRMRVKA